MAAPMLLDGPMNGPAFLACAEQVLAPELRPGDIVVMDCQSARKVDPGLECAPLRRHDQAEVLTGCRAC